MCLIIEVFYVLKEDITSLHDKKIYLPGKAEMSAHAVQTKYKSYMQVFCNEEFDRKCTSVLFSFIDTECFDIVDNCSIDVSVMISLLMPYHPTPPPLCSATHVAPRKASPIQFCTAMSKK